MKLKIGCLQFNPRLAQKERNIDAIKAILHGAATSPDILVLPELAVTGYNFASSGDIAHHLEDRSVSESPSIALAKQLSRKYNCFTLLGYPEHSNNTTYNSSIFIAPDGSELYNYRKTHLYETDEVWGCRENPATSKFESIDVVLDKSYYSKHRLDKVYKHYRVNIGICMDLNPYQFKAPFNSFEFSLKCFQQEADLILCPMAWLSPKSPSIQADLSSSEKLERGHELENAYFKGKSNYVVNLDKPPVLDVANTAFVPSLPDCSTVDYWILRFFPYLSHHSSFANKYFSHPVTVVTCNRVGVERDVMYGGSSSIFQFSNSAPSDQIDHTNPSVEVLGSLGQGEEGLLIREISLSDV